ncbi:hypothetical protein ACFL6I_18385 [candidate division KSB1 bacterium]
MAKKSQFSPNKVVYTYDLSKAKSSTKVRFVYLLKGRRDEDGLVKQFKGKFIAPGCFILPIKKDKEMQEVFQKWNIKPKRIEVVTHE